ncbi:MAG: LacI family DNA-binding transcriptional regulator [Pseudomonadota bacterium]
MSGKVSAHDVAAMAGVSQSAVSRVFTPGASVSEAMRIKVMAAADALGYRPNALARSLITGRSRMIGLVVAYLDNPFYSETLELMSRALQAEGYHVLVFMAGNQEDLMDTVLEEILAYQVDGIILASVGMSNDLSQRCDAAGIPVTLFNRSQQVGRVTSVTSDNRAGGAKAAEYLLAAGHTRIAHIAGWDGASTQRDREAGFCGALAARGVTLQGREVGNFDPGQAAAATRRLFSSGPAPDALFVSTDHMAFAVMDVLRYELGLRVPEDVSVIGYDDVAQAAWPSYDLTTIRQPANRMVAETVRLLIARIEGADIAARRVEIDGPLMIRGSTRSPEET